MLYTKKEIKYVIEKYQKEGYEVEIEINFEDKSHNYMIIPYKKEISFQRCGTVEEASGEIYFQNFDELLHAKTIDYICLDEDWDNISSFQCYAFEYDGYLNNLLGYMTYEGTKYAKEKVKNKKIKTINNLDDLFNIIIKSYRRKTAKEEVQEKWESNNPTEGQSDITALLVHELFNYDIYKVNIENKTHYFNKNNEDIIDLTSDSYTIYNKKINYEKSTKVNKDKLIKNKEIKERYDILINNIEELIKINEE